MPKYEPFDWYATPLYYDIIFDLGTKDEADFLQAMHEKYCQSDGHRILEPACGSGRLLIELARRGYDCLGYDTEPGMVQYAHELINASGQNIKVVPGKMESYRAKRKVDLAFCLVSTFKYLLTEEDAEAHLHATADSLKPGGIYVLGLHLSEYGETQRVRERWVNEREGIHVVCNIQSWPADAETRTEKVRSRLIVTEQNQTRQFESNWLFRTYDGQELLSLLDKVPQFEHVATYDFTYRPERPVEFDEEQLDQILVLRRVNPIRHGWADAAKKCHAAGEDKNLWEASS